MERIKNKHMESMGIAHPTQLFLALRFFKISSHVRTLTAGTAVYTLVAVIFLIINAILATLPYGFTINDINIAQLLIDKVNDGSFLQKVALTTTGIGFLINILVGAIMLQDFYDTTLKKAVIASFIVEFTISALLSIPLKS